MATTFKIITMFLSAGSVAALLAVAGARSAEADAPRRGPPPEALAACEDLEQGDACSVTLGERTLEGTCEALRDGELACKPARVPGRHGPPPEAIDACSGAAEGAACSVALGERTLEGTCEAFEGELACKPSGPPPEGPPGADVP